MTNKVDYLLSLCNDLQRRARISTSNADFEELSFLFSFWLGVGILLQQTSVVTKSDFGEIKRVINNAKSPDLRLSFIERASTVRSFCLQNECVDTEQLRSQFRSGRDILHILDIAGCSRIEIYDPRYLAVTTFLGWLKRLPVYVRDEEISVSAYLENEHRLRSLAFPQDLIDQLRAIWHEWFSEFELTQESFIPRHGTGSTADAGRIRSQKWDSLSIDIPLRVCLKDRQLSSLTVNDEFGDIRTAKVTFVPKQAGKDRTICTEPASLIYYQEGLSDSLDYFSSRPFRQISKYFDRRSQERNRTLCAQAYWGYLSTIDLSDASDSVSWTLVKALTRGIPLYRYLLACRSTHFLLKGKRYETAKFAPMGAATCFPIETYLFASIVENEYRKHYGCASRGHHSGCAVYGDDIICPDDLFPKVIASLNLLGFNVNTSKSFSTGPYRESCGVEYVRGFRVDTLKHPRTHLVSKGYSSSDVVGCYTDLINSLLLNGFTDCRKILLKVSHGIQVKVGKRVRLVSDYLHYGTGGCISINISECPAVWSHSYQRWLEVRRSPLIRCTKSDRDYDEFLSHCRPRTRERRLYEHYRRFNRLFSKGDSPLLHKWSLTGLAFLVKTQQWDILENGQVREPESFRAGPLRETEVVLLKPLVPSLSPAKCW